MNIYENIISIINNPNINLSKSDAKDILLWCGNNVENNEWLVNESVIKNITHLNEIYKFDELLPFDVVKKLYSLTLVTTNCRSFLYYGYTSDGKLKYNGNRDIKYYISRKYELVKLFQSTTKDRKIYQTNCNTYVEYVNNVLDVISKEKYIVTDDVNEVNITTKKMLRYIINELNQRGYTFEMINGCNTITDIEETFKIIKDSFFYNSYSKIDIYSGKLVVRYRDNLENFTIATHLQFNHSGIDCKIHLLYMYVLSPNFKYSFGFVDGVDKIFSNNSKEQIPERYRIMYLFIVDEMEKRGIINQLFRKDNAIYNSSLNEHLTNILDIFNRVDNVTIHINDNSQKLVCSNLNYISETVHHNAKSYTYIIELLYNYIINDEYQNHFYNSPHDITLNKNEEKMLMEVQEEAIRRGYNPPLTHQSIAFAVWHIHGFFRWDRILPYTLKESTFDKDIVRLIYLLHTYICGDEYKNIYMKRKNIFKRMINK